MKKTLKKAICIFIIILILSAPAAMAATSISLSSSTANPGDTITIWGTTDAAQFVSVRITDSTGNIVYFGGAQADISGNYSTVYTVPSNMTAGNLYVTTGSGGDTAAAIITVIIPSPTPQRAINPQTGDGSNTSALIVFLAVLCGIALMLYAVKSKKILFN